MNKNLPWRGVSWPGGAPSLCLCFLCLLLCLFGGVALTYRYCSGNGPGCNLNPANWALVNGNNSLPPIGRLAITEANVLLSSWPGPSNIPGRFGRNDERDSLSFLPLNLLQECSRPQYAIKFLAPVSSHSPAKYKNNTY